MDCIACGSALQCQARPDLTYYECPDCGGIWFNPGELEALVNRRIRISLSQPRRELAGDAKVTNECPVCGQGAHLVPMGIYAASGVRILGCSVCFGHHVSRAQAQILIDRVCHHGPLGWLHRLVRRQQS